TSGRGWADVPPAFAALNWIARIKQRPTRRRMPSLNFVLPHWLYWGTLIVFPLIAMFMVRRQRQLRVQQQASMCIAYLFWVPCGMMGLHGLYLRSYWGFVFVPVFLGVLYVNGAIRDAREDVSRTRSEPEPAHVLVNRAKPAEGSQAAPEE